MIGNARVQRESLPPEPYLTNECYISCRTLPSRQKPYVEFVSNLYYFIEFEGEYWYD